MKNKDILKNRVRELYEYVKLCNFHTAFKASHFSLGWNLTLQDLNKYFTYTMKKNYEIEGYKKEDIDTKADCFLDCENVTDDEDAIAEYEENGTYKFDPDKYFLMKVPYIYYTITGLTSKGKQLLNI